MKEEKICGILTRVGKGPPPIPPPQLTLVYTGNVSTNYSDVRCNASLHIHSFVASSLNKHVLALF